VIKTFIKRRVYAKGIHQIFTADLVDMQAFSKYNNGMKYLLTVIDIFSKYGWMKHLISKTGLKVANALEKYLKRESRINCGSIRGQKFSTKKYRNL